MYVPSRETGCVGGCVRPGSGLSDAPCGEGPSELGELVDGVGGAVQLSLYLQHTSTETY